MLFKSLSEKKVILKFEYSKKDNILFIQTHINHVMRNVKIHFGTIYIIGQNTITVPINTIVVPVMYDMIIL